jgi:hypothetical protein
MGNNWGWDDEAYTEPLSERAVDGAGGPTGLPAVITQELLDKFVALEAEHRRFSRMKRQLRAAVEAGVPVEPGPHQVELQVREQRSFTVSYVVAALGLSPEQVAELKASAPPRPRRYLRVR